MVQRNIQTSIEGLIDFDKAIIIKGARQVGKTTLIKALLAGKSNVLWIDGDDPQDRLLWNNTSKANLKLYIADFDFIVFDEAQRIENIGLTVKMILDLKMKKQVFISGSSSLNLSSSINEALTGRKWTFELFPFSWSEIVGEIKLFPAIQALDVLLIYGSYPEIFLSNKHKIRRLKELSSSYLYKDILEVGQIRKPDLIIKLLKALAFQVGAEVSYNELANMLQVDNQTIKKYIGLLEDSYVIFRIEPHATNKRKEIATSRKIYFYDNGIRNALINNYNPLSERNDIGALWENFIVSEFLKKQAYLEQDGTIKFWRTKSGSEIDLVLDVGPSLSVYEIKYNSKKKGKFSQLFIEQYRPEVMATINRANFFEYLK